MEINESLGSSWAARLFAQTSLTDTFFADILLFRAISVFFLSKVCTL